MAGCTRQVMQAFREAVLEEAYCDLSVTGLCQRAGVSRQSFYRDFTSKGGVLDALVLHDIVQPAIDLHELLPTVKMRSFDASMEHHMYQSIYADRAFYRSLVTRCPEGRDAFMSAAAASLMQFYLRMLSEQGREIQWCTQDPLREARYVANFLAHGKALLFVSWIENGFDMEVREMGNLSVQLTMPYWAPMP